VLLLWLYVRAADGAEMNAETSTRHRMEEPGEKTLGEKKQIGSLAQRSWEERAKRHAASGLAIGTAVSMPNYRRRLAAVRSLVSATGC
jgi:hypothetical protein